MPDASAILGATAFLGFSGALVYAGAVAGIAREALRPERRTMGWDRDASLGAGAWKTGAE